MYNKLEFESKSSMRKKIQKGRIKK
jgi:hypothetical protein